jgi:hypothetical protein
MSAKNANAAIVNIASAKKRTNKPETKPIDATRPPAIAKTKRTAIVRKPTAAKKKTVAAKTKIAGDKKKNAAATILPAGRFLSFLDFLDRSASSRS